MEDTIEYIFNSVEYTSNLANRSQSAPEKRHRGMEGSYSQATVDNNHNAQLPGATSDELRRALLTVARYENARKVPATDNMQA